MRGRLVFAAVSSAMIAAGFVACGLDEGGLLVDGGPDGATDSPPFDAPIDVPIDVPQACKTLDASACVSAAIPDGWTLVVTSPGDVLCPTTVDYDKSNFLTNVQPQGPCLCTCSVSGTLDCSGVIEAGTQPGCNGNKSLLFDAGNDAACINTNWNDPHISVGPLPPASSANAHCDASAPPPAWTASTTTACTPKCTADFCNVGSTYERCIISSQNLLCPAPFTKAEPVFGVEAGVTTSCTGCGCAINPAACNAIIQPFQSNDCVNALADASLANGTCHDLGGGNNVSSFTYAPVVPLPQCGLTNSGTASAGFTTSVTVCCLP